MHLTISSQSVTYHINSIQLSYIFQMYLRPCLMINYSTAFINMAFRDYVTLGLQKWQGEFKTIVEYTASGDHSVTFRVPQWRFLCPMLTCHLGDRQWTACHNMAVEIAIIANFQLSHIWGKCIQDIQDISEHCKKTASIFLVRSIKDYGVTIWKPYLKTQRNTKQDWKGN